MTTSFYPGQRVSYSGALCTVRYVGPVDGTKGTWLGVEWDDPARGKHAGEHEGRKYFECRSNSITAGSFVRPTRPHDRNRSFVEAMSVKYAPDSFQSMNQPTSGVEIETVIQISGKEVEEVGFDKIRQQLADFKELRVVLLDGLCLSRPEARSRPAVQSSEDDDIAMTCPKVIDLEISRNLFEHVSEIIDVCRQLPKLRSLKMNGNRLHRLDENLFQGLSEMYPFKYLGSLSLDNTLLTWKEISHICGSLPKLLELSASANEYNGIADIDPSNFQSLKQLSLERNHFTSLHQILPLRKLPSLVHLSLKSNRISQPITYSAFSSQDETFPQTLASLDVSYNEIDSFITVSALQLFFPGLTKLMIAHNPVFSNQMSATTGLPLAADDYFMLTMARLGNVTTLNYSNISSKERLNAETYYMSMITAELSRAPAGHENLVLARHPRYQELCDVYGERKLEPKHQVINPNTLQAGLVEVEFVLSEEVYQASQIRATQESERCWKLEVPKSFTVYNVLGLVGQRTGLRPLLLKLVWETGEEDVIRDEQRLMLESDDESETTMAIDGAQTEKLPVTRLREEVLVPRLRSLGTWLEGSHAKIRVEWSELDKTRFEAAMNRSTRTQT